MSLLFEHAVDQFQVEDASLVAAETADLTTTEAEIPVSLSASLQAIITPLHTLSEIGRVSLYTVTTMLT